MSTTLTNRKLNFVKRKKKKQNFLAEEEDDKHELNQCIEPEFPRVA